MALPLSPRAVNRQARIPADKMAATKPAASKPFKAADDKYAPPPPKIVQDPSGQQYHTGRELGKGGFAICYEASLKGDDPSAPKIALKIVKAHMPAKKMEEKFRTELQIHSRMRHPNIVEFHRAFTYGKSTYIVLELCTNGSLKDMCTKRKVLSMPEIRRYGIQICGAVKYMHERNVIHRDLKMGNLFMDQDMNIKIGDFGLAAIYLNESDEGFVSRRTTLCGTPNYIAPEILDRKAGHDHKVDLWAVGVILYTLMIGRPPFARSGDKNNDIVYQRVKTVDYGWPTETRNDVPEEAKELVALLLNPDAEARPEPDLVADHPFFSMNGGWDIPSSIDTSCMVSPPTWLENKFPRGDVMARSATRVSNTQLGEQCGVGSSPHCKKVGSNYGQSLYQDFLLEEAAGRTPVVPLPEGTIYAWVPPRLPARQRTASIRTVSARAPATRSISSSATLPTRALSARVPSTRSTIRGAPSRAATTISKSTTLVDESEPLSESPSSLFGPNEQTERVLGTKNAEVLSMLKAIVASITLSLHATKPGTDFVFSSLDTVSPRPPVVVKWVDYSNKFGIGYLLENGTVGCIFKGHDLPLSSVVVADVESHLQKRNNAAVYADKQQIVRKDGAMVEFYEPCADGDGLRRLAAHPKRYQVRAADSKLGPGADKYDDEKRHLLGLWDKFARYMTQTLGKAPDGGNERARPARATGPFVKFYQRLGNVGVWGFSDGGFQFNFPDHTKLILSKDAAWADFYHLPVEAGKVLLAGGVLTKEVLDKRAVLRCRLDVLLHGVAPGGCDFRAVLAANELRPKVEFVRDVVRTWVRQGGLGLSRPGEKLAWGGMSEVMAKEKKLAWVTIGL